MASKKQYIGSGKATKYDGVKVTLNLKEADPHVYTTDRGTYVSFIVTPRKNPTDHVTHNVFVLVDAEEPVPAVAEPAAEAPAPAKKGRRKKA